MVCGWCISVEFRSSYRTFCGFGLKRGVIFSYVCQMAIGIVGGVACIMYLKHCQKSPCDFSENWLGTSSPKIRTGEMFACFALGMLLCYLLHSGNVALMILYSLGQLLLVFFNFLFILVRSRILRSGGAWELVDVVVCRELSYLWFFVHMFNNFVCSAQLPMGCDSCFLLPDDKRRGESS